MSEERATIQRNGIVRERTSTENRPTCERRVHSARRLQAKRTREFRPASCRCKSYHEQCRIKSPFGCAAMHASQKPQQTLQVASALRIAVCKNDRHRKAEQSTLEHAARCNNNEWQAEKLQKDVWTRCEHDARAATLDTVSVQRRKHQDPSSEEAADETVRASQFKFRLHSMQCGEQVELGTSPEREEVSRTSRRHSRDSSTRKNCNFISCQSQEHHDSMPCAYTESGDQWSTGDRAKSRSPSDFRKATCRSKKATCLQLAATCSSRPRVLLVSVLTTS